MILKNASIHTQRATASTTCRKILQPAFVFPYRVQIDGSIRELCSGMNRNKPSNGLEISIGNIVPVTDVSNVLYFSQDGINVAINGLILDRAQGFTGHSLTEDACYLVD
ncbi:hypothetical protein BN961_02139 [Afipia felis]|uniref:Uncharacterized protein n=1 Tax=Afipia felis TaxID=1035 RepID=A0A090MMW1_AFIFE|nr:hypothetical protein BN961_02139 [Afipia felis]